MVGGDSSDGSSAQLCGPAGGARGAWHGRIGGLSVLFKDHCQPFSGGAARLRELGCGFRTLFWTQLRTAVWRHADGAVRLASVFRDAGVSEFAVDWTVVDMDAASEIARGS